MLINSKFLLSPIIQMHKERHRIKRSGIGSPQFSVASHRGVDVEVFVTANKSSCRQKVCKYTRIVSV